MKFFTIPIFVPEQACPNRCIFCNQSKISGCRQQPEPDEVREIIERNLLTLPSVNAHIDIAFFGGNFTGIDINNQRDYLSIAQEYFLNNKIHGIRLSTRPDYISPEILKLLKEYNVTTIELGAQSLNDDVLAISERGHNVKDIENASFLLKKNGFRLGLQMMIGLPGSSRDKDIATAKKILELEADETRIYPTLVIKDTKLESLWQEGQYHPLSLNEAINLSADIMEIFNKSSIKVLRVGLHPSEDLNDSTQMLAGPFHPSFRHLVDTEIWRRKIQNIIDSSLERGTITIRVSEKEINNAVGYLSANKRLLTSYFEKVNYEIERETNNKLVFVVSRHLPLPAKNHLKKLGNVHFLNDSVSVYKSISSHADIFLCGYGTKLVAAPSVFSEIKELLSPMGYEIYKGKQEPGKSYPQSAIYNAVITENHIIHNTKISDPVVLEVFSEKNILHVNQGYTRCNLIEISKGKFLTSDKGIELKLLSLGYRILYIDPQEVILKGQKHGFFPGACGKYNNQLLVAGDVDSLSYSEKLLEFIAPDAIEVITLFKGRITDIGSIFVFKAYN